MDRLNNKDSPVAIIQKEKKGNSISITKNVQNVASLSFFNPKAANQGKNDFNGLYNRKVTLKEIKNLSNQYEGYTCQKFLNFFIENSDSNTETALDMKSRLDVI